MLEKRLENARRDGDGKPETLKSELGEAKKIISDKDRQVRRFYLFIDFVHT